MIPIDVFILRQKTRPSEEECQALFLNCLSNNEEGLRNLLNEINEPSHLQTAIRSANLNRETDDIDQQLQAFIKVEGGERYFTDRARFIVEIFQFLSGSPPEKTRVAIVYVRDVKIKDSQHIPAVGEFLARGAHWEELERWGDALSCYYIGLLLHPEQPDLLTKLGEIQMRYPRYQFEAVKNLNKAIELRPADHVALLYLGRCYQLVANNQNIEVKGRPKKELRQIALGVLERATVIEPDNPDIQREVESLRQELGISPGAKGSKGFFEEE